MGFVNYMKEVRNELRHVTWPSSRQTILFTAIVIVLSIGAAYFLGLFDFLFTKFIDVFVV